MWNPLHLTLLTIRSCCYDCTIWPVLKRLHIISSIRTCLIDINGVTSDSKKLTLVFLKGRPYLDLLRTKTYSDIISLLHVVISFICWRHSTLVTITRDRERNVIRSMKKCVVEVYRNLWEMFFKCSNKMGQHSSGKVNSELWRDFWSNNVNAASYQLYIRVFVIIN